MEEKIYKIDGLGWYVPLKKIIIISTNKKLDILPSEIVKKLSNFEGYEQEVKKLPRDQFKLHELCIKSMGILLTNQCTLRCIYCFSEAGDKKEETLSNIQIETVIRELVKNAVINKKISRNKIITSELTISGGGEPTYYWDKFTFCVEKFRKLCLENEILPKIKIVTNGCLSKEHTKYVIKNIDEINLSFDGTKDIQNHQRPLRNGDDSFELVKNFINACGEANKDILVRATVMPENFGKLVEIVDDVFMTFENIDCLHLEPMIVLGRANYLENCHEYELTEFMYNYIDVVKMVKEKYKGREVVNSMFSYGLTEYFCSASLGTHPWVHMDGKIMPCKDYMTDKKHIVGEISSKGIEYNREFEPLLYNLSKCKSCFAYYHCGGGCSINMPKDEDGNCILGSSREMCKMIRTYWESVLNILVNEKAFGNIRIEEIDSVRLDNYKLYKIITS